MVYIEYLYIHHSSFIIHVSSFTHTHHPSSTIHANQSSCGERHSRPTIRAVCPAARSVATRGPRFRQVFRKAACKFWFVDIILNIATLEIKEPYTNLYYIIYVIYNI